MTLAAARSKSAGAARTSSAFPVWAAVAIALAAAALLTLPRISAVWGAGEFFDSDDAMRAVQTRDLLAGQGWFDMTARRIDPPSGLFMHWSRIVDAPLAISTSLFGSLLSPEEAERATRLVFPLACLAALLALAAWNARILAGEASRIPAVWLTFLSAPMLTQFAPGRIDHHAPQIVLLMTALGLFNLGLDERRRAAMAPAAFAMALSVAISLENLPLFAALLAALLAIFIVDGDGGRLASFALGAFVSFPLCFALTVGPSRYGVSTCDAYSAVHLAAALVGAIGLAALALLAPRLDSRAKRAVAATFAGAGVVATIVALAPHCIGDPLGGLDPLLRDLWLSHVAEAKPIAAFADDRAMVAAIVLPVVLGLLAALAAAWTASGLARRRFAATAGAIVVGLAVASWQIRAFSSVTPIAMVASACGAVALARRLTEGYSSMLRLALTAVLCLAASPIGIALALPSGRDAPPAERRACLGARAFAPLASLRPSRIAAPIDVGAHLLAFTPHSVFGAPYHRDNHGNRVVVDAFLAPPAEAERVLREAGAELALWCAGDGIGSELVRRAPSGLAASLARGDVPGWLEKIPLDETPFHVFALRPSP